MSMCYVLFLEMMYATLTRCIQMPGGDVIGTN